MDVLGDVDVAHALGVEFGDSGAFVWGESFVANGASTVSDELEDGVVADAELGGDVDGAETGFVVLDYL